MYSSFSFFLNVLTVKILGQVVWRVQNEEVNKRSREMFRYFENISRDELVFNIRPGNPPFHPHNVTR